MYDFLYDYIKPRYQDKTNLSYMYRDNFLVNIKTMIFIKTLQMTLKKDFTYQTMKLRPITIGKNTKTIVLMKSEFGGTIMTEFI